MTDDSKQTVTIDGTGYNISDLSENAKAQLTNIGFVDKQLQQLKNEWAVADTARLAYVAALKNELIHTTQSVDENDP